MTQKPTNAEIYDAWDLMDDPDISTARLFAMVRDHFNGTIDDGDISTALYEEGLKRGTIQQETAVNETSTNPHPGSISGVLRSDG